MILIGRNDPCACGSGKPYKVCCKQKTKLPTKEIPWVLYPEKFVLSGILQQDEKFEVFYLQERPKIYQELLWAEDDSLPEGIDFKCTRFYEGDLAKDLVIRLRYLPAREQDGIKIAHELLHLVLDLEGYPSGGTRNQNYTQVASSLSSAILDPIINIRLHNYGFNIREEFLAEQKDFLKNIMFAPYPNNQIINALWVFNYLGALIDHKLVELKTGLIECEFNEWFAKQHPQIAHESIELSQLLDITNFDSPEVIRQLFSKIVARYDFAKDIIID